jgi:hypothetical protein
MRYTVLVDPALTSSQAEEVMVGIYLAHIRATDVRQFWSIRDE